ncbi:MAG: VWA domain-containing protein [Chlorobi bacterium]|nr:VWA domain-containing protein [Chlorobiota bacterium]
MCFAWPDNSGYLLLLIPLAVLFGYGYMRQMQARERLGPAAAAGGENRLFFCLMLQFAAIAILLFALTGPQLCGGKRVVFRKGADVVFMLDVSGSMLAADVPSNRLERAKDAARFIGARIGDGRLALLLFAGSPLVQCPLTLDREVFDALLAASSPDLVETKGTSFAPAIDLALRLFAAPRRAGGDGAASPERIVVLLSDGEDHEGGLAAAAEKLKRAGVTLFVLGAGSRTDALVPDPRYPGGVRRDAAGAVVRTRFSPATLEKLAVGANGLYFDTAGGDAVYDHVAQRIERIVEASRPVPVPSGGSPLYHGLPGGAMALLLVERFLRVSRNVRKG